MKTMPEKMDMAAALRAAGFRATPARMELLATLARTGKPLTVEDILKLQKGTAPDQATVYRALKELRDAGLVRQVDFEHGHAHYEAAGQDDHHHLVCTSCGKVEDFTGCHIENIKKAALRQSKMFKKIERHSLELFGTCTACRKKGE